MEGLIREPVSRTWPQRKRHVSAATGSDPQTLCSTGGILNALLKQPVTNVALSVGAQRTPVFPTADVDGHSLHQTRILVDSADANLCAGNSTKGPGMGLIKPGLQLVEDQAEGSRLALKGVVHRVGAATRPNPLHMPRRREYSINLWYRASCLRFSFPWALESRQCESSLRSSGSCYPASR